MIENQLSGAGTQPMIVKFSQPYANGIQSHHISRHTIGYVLRGHKFIYNGDARFEVRRGEIFFLAKGHHYTEDVPEAGQPFEQITFYYSPEQLGRILSTLSLTYNMDITNDHTCALCREASSRLGTPHATSSTRSINIYATTSSHATAPPRASR